VSVRFRCDGSPIQIYTSRIHYFPRGTGTPYERSSHCSFYETIKRELKIKPISECRCDERLKTKTEESTRLRHWVARGTGTPEDKDEVNRREVYECDG
jgi:hypothetical protein